MGHVQVVGIVDARANGNWDFSYSRHKPDGEGNGGVNLLIFFRLIDRYIIYFNGKTLQLVGALWRTRSNRNIGFE